ncbi:MAG: HEAT repeat domain-containing protein [Pirellulales bacterium]
MSQGISTTFALLAETSNEAADALLASALESKDARIRDAALGAVLTRHSPECHRRLIEKLHEFDQTWRERIAAQHERLSSAVRECVLSKTEQTCKNACEAILWFRDYDLLQTLLNAAEDQSNPHRKHVAETLTRLIEHFYEELAGPRDYARRRDPQRMRDYFIGLLETSLSRFSKHQSHEILEAFLLLVQRDNSLLKQILNEPRHPAYLAITEMLTHSPRGGVMRLVLSFLDDPHAASSGITLLAYRTDHKFLDYLLRKIGYEPSAQVSHNLRRIENIAWLQGDLSHLSRFNEAAQHAVGVLAVRAAISRRDAFHVLEWLLLHGKAGGRRGAAKLLSEFNGAEANSLLLQALTDPDPQVQATLIAQIRPRGIAGAMNRLMEFLKSPHECVRVAAREGLSEFSFKRYLTIYDMLDEDVRISTGRIVLKVDPTSLTELLQEYRAPARTRRLRAMAITQLLDVVYAMEEALIGLIDDEDHVVRAEAVRALGRCDTETARFALERAKADRSAIVQEAAEQSLDELAAAPPPCVPPLPWETGALA